MRLPALIAAALAACATPGFAEIEKLATPCERELCFYWWPKLPSLAGWSHDREQSFQLRVNALAPEGEPFARAETVMYAKAIYKPRRPEATSLAKLIEADQGDFSKNVPGVRIAPAPPLTTADGQKLVSFTFLPLKGGNWERVSYGEEGDFYLVFAISSRSKSGYESSMESYEKLVGGYRTSP